MPPVCWEPVRIHTPAQSPAPHQAHFGMLPTTECGSKQSGGIKTNKENFAQIHKMNLDLASHETI